MENRDIRFLLNLQMLADGIRKSFPELEFYQERMAHVWKECVFSRKERSWIPVMCILQM